jgi:hypothetical protein
MSQGPIFSGVGLLFARSEHSPAVLLRSVTFQTPAVDKNVMAGPASLPIEFDSRPSPRARSTAYGVDLVFDLDGIVRVDELLTR